MGTEAHDTAVIADAIGHELALGPGLTRCSGGSVPVYTLGNEHVVKFFPAAETSFFTVERAALISVDGRLSIPTPRLHAAGERDGWSYIVMTRLPGVSLADAWPGIGAEERLELMRGVGVALATLHATPTDRFAPLAIDWPQFVRDQGASCRERQRAKGLASPWVDAIDDFLARWTPADHGQRVLLHTEIMREHLLVEHHADGWRISGLIDFEPAMLGAPEYEFASVGIFLTGAEPGLLGVLLDAYGVETDDEFPLRVMAYALLHRYSNLRWYLERLPGPDESGDLEGLARRWFTPRTIVSERQG